MEHVTTEGVQISMRRVKDVKAPGKDRGWVTHRVTATIEDIDLGHLSISWIPDFDERYPTLQAYAEGFAGGSGSKESMRRSRAFHSFPFVAAVFVDFLKQRHHIGLALYRESALWLAEEWGLTLRQGDPNPTAERLWAKLKALGEPIREVDVLDYRPRLELDYTDLVNRCPEERIQDELTP